MSENKSEPRTIRMRPEVRELVFQYMERNHINFTTAVNEILYSALSNGASNKNEIAAEEIAGKVVDVFAKKYDYPIRRIASKTKFIDETASSIMEMLNEMCIRAGYHEVPEYHGDTYKSAREKVKKEISKGKERNDNQR